MLRGRLAVKISVLIVAVFVVGFGASTIWTVQREAELLVEQWKTDKGQEEILKVLEFMDTDAVNEILAQVPGPLVRDVMQKRLRVTKVPASPAPERK